MYFFSKDGALKRWETRLLLAVGCFCRIFCHERSNVGSKRRNGDSWPLVWIGYCVLHAAGGCEAKQACQWLSREISLQNMKAPILFYKCKKHFLSLSSILNYICSVYLFISFWKHWANWNGLKGNFFSYNFACCFVWAWTMDSQREKYRLRVFVVYRCGVYRTPPDTTHATRHIKVGSLRFVIDRDMFVPIHHTECKELEIYTWSGSR
jgi:hypothetical protein